MQIFTLPHAGQYRMAQVLTLYFTHLNAFITEVTVDSDLLQGIHLALPGMAVKCNIM